LFASGAFWGTQAGYPAYASYLNRRDVLIAPMDIMRACARRLIGNNALVGGRLGLWYISGAQSWYEVAPELLWRSDISDISLPDYFSKFDYVVENSHMSNTTINSQLESLPSWYVNGILKLHGFVLNDQNHIMDTLVLKTSAPAKISGYIVEEHTISTRAQQATSFLGPVFANSNRGPLSTALICRTSMRSIYQRRPRRIPRSRICPTLTRMTRNRRWSRS
jgi:hypothetical protein